MTEIFGLYSFGKVSLLTNRIPSCDVFNAKKAFMHYIIYLRVTSGKTLCKRREQRINLSVFHCVSIYFPRFASTIELDKVVMAAWPCI
jgi:hypothetical protein